MSSPSASEIEAMLEGGSELVTFSGLGDVITCDRDVIVTYTVGPDVTTTPRDWIGLFRCGWSSWKDQVRYVWTQKTRRRQKQPEQRKWHVMFRKNQLLGLHLDGSYFQFVYVSRDHDILGVSSKFMLVADTRVYNLLTASMEDVNVGDEYLDGLVNLFEVVESKKSQKRSAKQRRKLKRKHDELAAQAGTVETNLVVDIVRPETRSMKQKQKSEITSKVRTSEVKEMEFTQKQKTSETTKKQRTSDFTAQRAEIIQLEDHDTLTDNDVSQSVFDQPETELPVSVYKPVFGGGLGSETTNVTNSSAPKYRISAAATGGDSLASKTALAAKQSATVPTKSAPTAPTTAASVKQQDTVTTKTSATAPTTAVAVKQPTTVATKSAAIAPKTAVEAKQPAIKSAATAPTTAGAKRQATKQATTVPAKSTATAPTTTIGATKSTTVPTKTTATAPITTAPAPTPTASPMSFLPTVPAITWPNFTFTSAAVRDIDGRRVQPPSTSLGSHIGGTRSAIPLGYTGSDTKSKLYTDRESGDHKSQSKIKKGRKTRGKNRKSLVNDVVNSVISSAVVETSKKAVLQDNTPQKLHALSKAAIGQQHIVPRKNMIAAKETPRERRVSCSNSEPMCDDGKRRQELTNLHPKESMADCHVQANLMAMSVELHELIGAKTRALELEAESRELRAALENQQNQNSELLAENSQCLRQIHELTTASTEEKCSNCERVTDDVMCSLYTQGFSSLLDHNGNKVELSTVLGSLTDQGAWQATTNKRAEKTQATIRRQEKTIDSMRTELTSRANQCELLSATNRKLNNDLERRDRDATQTTKQITLLEHDVEVKVKDADTLTKDLLASRNCVKSLTEIFAMTEKDLKEQIRRLQVKLATRTLSAKKRVMNVSDILSCSVDLLDREQDKNAVSKKRKIKPTPSTSDKTSSTNEKSAPPKVPSLNHVDEPAVNDISDFSSENNLQATKFQVIDESDSSSTRQRPKPTYASKTKSESLNGLDESEAGFLKLKKATAESRFVKTSPRSQSSNAFRLLQGPVSPKSISLFMQMYQKPTVNEIQVSKSGESSTRKGNVPAFVKAIQNGGVVDEAMIRGAECSQTADDNYTENATSREHAESASASTDRNVIPESFNDLTTMDDCDCISVPSVWDRVAHIAKETCRFCGFLPLTDPDSHVFDEHKAFRSTHK